MSSNPTSAISSGTRMRPSSTNAWSTPNAMRSLAANTASGRSRAGRVRMRFPAAAPSATVIAAVGMTSISTPTAFSAATRAPASRSVTSWSSNGPPTKAIRRRPPAMRCSTAIRPPAMLSTEIELNLFWPE